MARWFQAPRLVEGLERAERTRALQGVEVRYPFLDRELVELVLSVPFELRRAVWPPYPFKAALRTALRDDLPVLVRERGGKVVFDDYSMRLTESWRQLLLPRPRAGGRMGHEGVRQARGREPAPSGASLAGRGHLERPGPARLGSRDRRTLVSAGAPA